MCIFCSTFAAAFEKKQYSGSSYHSRESREEGWVSG